MKIGDILTTNDGGTEVIVLAERETDSCKGCIFTSKLGCTCIKPHNFDEIICEDFIFAGIERLDIEQDSVTMDVRIMLNNKMRNRNYIMPDNDNIVVSTWTKSSRHIFVYEIRTSLREYEEKLVCENFSNLKITCYRYEIAR